jgi:hypothetical protein
MNMARRVAMAHGDAAYFEARAERELEMAKRAKTVEAAAVHEVLAQHYQARLRGFGESLAPTSP